LYQSNTYKDTSFYSYAAFTQYKTKHLNGHACTVPFLSLLADQTTVVHNKNLLVGSVNTLGNISGVRYKVQISDTESYWYRTWSTGDNNVNFNNDTSTCLLILDE
jgi:shikimate 5-dehydrogenase